MTSIPEYARPALEDRLETHARTAWIERCAGVNVRFRGKYAYVEVFDSDPWTMPGSTNEEKEQIRQTPVKMCRFTGYRFSSECAFIAVFGMLTQIESLTEERTTEQRPLLLVVD